LNKGARKTTTAIFANRHDRFIFATEEIPLFSKRYSHGGDTHVADDFTGIRLFAIHCALNEVGHQSTKVRLRLLIGQSTKEHAEAERAEINELNIQRRTTSHPVTGFANSVIFTFDA
jgi:hypothetical protein